MIFYRKYKMNKHKALDLSSISKAPVGTQNSTKQFSDNIEARAEEELNMS